MTRDSVTGPGSSLPCVLFCLALATACDSVVPPGSPSPTPSPSPKPASLQYRVSGTVTDAGSKAPVAGATVMLRLSQGELTARTDERGQYAFSFEKGQPYRGGLTPVPANTLGMLIVGHGAFLGDVTGGHWTGVYALPLQESDMVQDVRLRPVRTLQAGQVFSLPVEADSSLVWDQEYDPWTFPSFDSVWEEFFVSVPANGTLTVDVRPQAGSIAGLVECRYVGCPSWRVESSVSIFVEARWSPLYFNVQVPRSSAPQRYDIHTSFR